MHFSVTPDILKEKAFQTAIKEYLIHTNEYKESFNKDYSRELSLDTACLFAFLEATQEKAVARLKEIYGYNFQNKVLENLQKELRRNGSHHVIKHGFKDYGVKLNLAYFKPPTALNPEQYYLYKQNILSVTEELVYDSAKKDRIDLVIFLNGIPILTMELKNSFTGQTCKDAINQYKFTRSNKDQLFKFRERSLVNFAVDTDEVYMTTKLQGASTVFLPFNKGYNGGRGNPPLEGKLKTSYLWEEVLQKDSLLDIIHKFLYLEVRDKVLPNGEKETKKTVIFPRYHQLDAVRKILVHAKQHKSGNKYLIQHSAGSGKTNSITWLSHRLASLHDEQDEIIFHGVIVVTDRRVLDKQLQDAIYQMEHKLGMVAKIDQGSTQLAEELDRGTKIIISTIQKFPFVLEKIDATKGKRYAVIIDEAHSSTSGRGMMSLKESLSLEEAEAEAQQEEYGEFDAEDEINAQLERFTDTSHLSFFAFTATPKPTTLRLFGSPCQALGDQEPNYRAFHIYSMRQAIEEGFILDVLKNYMTYTMYYNVNKKIDDDPSIDKSKAMKEIIRYVTLHPHNISQKTEIIVEHFRNFIMDKIGGEAKAMLVTPSRLHAVRYKLQFDSYIKEKGYDDLKTLVAYSGTMKDGGMEYTEPRMNNGISEQALPKEFDKEESRILIVANKYQTGFDQPKLHTMYVDKKISGVKAVQTLSRLNRTCAGKEDTFVMDFVNKPEDIQRSFQPFYQTTVLRNDIEPNDIYLLQQKIFDKKVIQLEDVYAFANLFYKKKHSAQDQSIMNNLVDKSLERMKDFTRDELIDFRNLCKQFINLYSLIIQVTPFIDTEVHRLTIYLRFLIKKIDIESPTGVDITDKVLLQYYKLQNQGETSIPLPLDEDGGVVISDPKGEYSTGEQQTDLLSEIIRELNERFGTEFADSEKLAVEQIMTSLKSDQSLAIKAKENTYDYFRYAFEKSFIDNVTEEFDKNQTFFGKILQDSEFQEKLMNLMMFEVYQSHKVEQGRLNY